MPCLCLLLFCCALIALMIHMISPQDTLLDSNIADQNLLDALESTPDAQQILQNPEHYPATLVELVVKNEETLQFVLDYPELYNTPPASTIGNITEGEIPMLLQWDHRWGYTTYGNDFLAVTGCGPTCISMVAAGLSGDSTITPHRVAQYAEANGYYVDGSGSDWSLMTSGCQQFGLSSEQLPLTESGIKQALDSGYPIICSMFPGDFTTTGHFIVLVGTDNGQIRLHDPNSIQRSTQLWDYAVLESQIANLWKFWLT